MCGWGAWEVAFRWTYLNLSATQHRAGQSCLPGVAGPPPSPNAGVLNESTVALNWWWNQYTRVQFNWIHSMPDYNAFGFSSDGYLCHAISNRVLNAHRLRCVLASSVEAAASISLGSTPPRKSARILLTRTFFRRQRLRARR